ncbi:MAG: efflux RND transporter periplasmic adaptor subunit [Planctomycetia bacterium]
MSSQDDLGGGGRGGLDHLHVLQRTTPGHGPGRPWLPRVVLGLVALGGAVALWLGVLQPLLFPPREVRVMRVREVAGPSGAVRRALAQAAGWLEADPWPVTVRPLVRGVVERLAVLEGQAVKRGETVVAVLASPELENAQALAVAELEVRVRERARASARLAQAEAVLAQRVDLRAALLAAEVEARRDRELVLEAEAALAQAEAALRRAEVEVRAQRLLVERGGSAPLSVSLAEAALVSASAERDLRRAALARARAELDVHERSLGLAREAHDRPRGLEGEVQVAREELAVAQAGEESARAALQVARSNVALLTVRSPSDGVVLRLLSSQGAPAGPEGEMRESLTIGPGSSGALDAASGALVALYDPQRMQVRVEVPLADLVGIGEGTEVAVEVESVPGQAFTGTVTRLLGEANIQNNKLWVKVRLASGDARLKPEMLARCRFLAREGEAGAAGARPRLEVPEGALQGEAVFVLDPTAGGQARRVPVRRLGLRDGWVEVEGALGSSNEVILEPSGLQDGARVRALR